jgi:hypothetical protein
VVRTFLALCSSTLKGLFAALLIFAPDVRAQIDLQWRTENAAIIASAERQVDAESQQAGDDIKTGGPQVTALQNQVTALRQQIVDPAAGDSALQAAQKDVERFTAEKAQEDQALQADQDFAADELNGIKGNRDNSGRRGNGPRYRAAEARANNAKTADDTATNALNTARARLEELTRQSGSRAGGRREAAEQQLQQTQQDLATASADLAGARDRYSKLSQNRDTAVGAIVDNAPGHIAPDNGLLGQLGALQRIAAGKPEVRAVILLVDAFCFILELSAVLARVFGYVPTAYGPLVVKEACESTIRIADALEETINGKPRGLQGEEEIPPLSDQPDDDEDGPEKPDPDDPPSPPSFGPIMPNGHDSDDPPPPPPKRGRGRPRKNPPG